MLRYDRPSFQSGGLLILKIKLKGDKNYAFLFES